MAEIEDLDAILRRLEEAAYHMSEAERKAQANKAVEAIKRGYTAASRSTSDEYEVRFPGFPAGPAPKPTRCGFNCSRCGLRNDDATANQSDGTYICYECRV